ncbi:TetR/AcrR family transcriptional regulator [Aeromicrobium sp. CTD01-1L150]|uniref:TetR/AcrR family transcriptional regulator n=1 Tax=Aeromicrobium sp. CTD01-1L150 TaxID=3341830 RepID=UPI0035C1792F
MRADAADNRERILAAYLDLIRSGHAQPSGTDVAAAADVARITLFRHFASHDVMRHAAIEQTLCELDATFHDALEHPTAESVLTNVVKTTLEYTRVLHRLTRGEDYYDRQLVRAWIKHVRPVVDFIVEAQERGEIRSDLPAAWLADALLSIVVVAGSSRSVAADARDPSDLVLALFLHGAAPQPKEPSTSSHVVN